MKLHLLKEKKWNLFFTFNLLLLIVVIFTGCTSIKFVADYDEEIDRGITSFQKKMEFHLIKLERNIGKEDARYESSIDFYDQIKVDLSALKVRAAALPQNDITLQQLDLIIENVNLLEKLHKLGISSNDIEPLRNAFNISTTAILKFELAKKRGIKNENK